MSEPAQKCENTAIFKRNSTPKLFIAFKMDYFSCFGLRGNLNFRDFLPKSCKTSTTGPSIIRPKFDAVDNGRNPSRHFFKIRRIGMLH